tara:strand:- start:12 stop:419 length:408 start_codon:yes stop_codon:yes gene_type:complete
VSTRAEALCGLLGEGGSEHPRGGGIPGDTLAIIIVRQLPPRLSLSSRVSFESRYGTCPPRSLASALMQLASASRLRLMLAPSLSRFVARPPAITTPVLLARSEPARSIKLSLPPLWPDAWPLVSTRSWRDMQTMG